jgi:serine/threonine-protein kinase
MASIWVGRQRGKHGFERLVAVKTILPQYASDPDLCKMLIDEARLSSSIRHTNVAEILDVGEERGVVYIVMEWIDGDSLLSLYKKVVRDGSRIPLPIVLRACADTSRGLHAAHELCDPQGELLGVVHRDVSPHNIMLDSAGTAKLIDFGVAKARQRLTGQTSTGILKGKARYMPPEQALGRDVDRRADIWAMGAVIQYLLTGTTPYSGDTDLATLQLIAGGGPYEPLPADVPKAVVEVVSRALARRPQERFASAADLAAALEGALSAIGGPATTSTDLAAFVRSAGLGDRRKRTIDAALVAAAERSRGAQRHEVRAKLPPVAARPIDATQRLAAEEPTAASMQSNIAPATPVRASRLPWRAMVGIALFVVGAAGFWRPWRPAPTVLPLVNATPAEPAVSVSSIPVDVEPLPAPTSQAIPVETALVSSSEATARATSPPLQRGAHGKPGHAKPPGTSPVPSGAAASTNLIGF